MGSEGLSPPLATIAADAAAGTAGDMKDTSLALLMRLASALAALVIEAAYCSAITLELAWVYLDVFNKQTHGHTC